MAIPRRHDILVHIDARHGFSIGRVERWENKVLTLLLADQEAVAADVFYEKYFRCRWDRPPANTFYFWPRDLMKLTFTHGDRRGQWKHIDATTVYVVSII